MVDIKFSIGGLEKLIEKASEAIAAINNAYWRRKRAAQYVTILKHLEEWYGRKVALASRLKDYREARAGSNQSRTRSAKDRLSGSLRELLREIGKTKEAIDSLGPTVGKKVRPLLNDDLLGALVQTDIERLEWMHSVLEADDKKLLRLQREANGMAKTISEARTRMGELANTD